MSASNSASTECQLDIERSEPLRVALLPGIWMPAASLHVLDRRLARAGFRVRRMGYPGVLGGPVPALRSLLPIFEDADAVVCHSLGGLIALEALRLWPQLPLRRIVCLGSPLGGSSVAQRLRGRQMDFVLGRSADLLVAGCTAPAPAHVAVGMVAGTRGLGAGALFGGFGGPSDGTVAVAETRWPGLADHVTVAASHSGLVWSAAAAGEVIHFLQHGRFRAGDAMRAAGDGRVPASM